MNGLPDYAGFSERDLLIRCLEKIETLFICVNEQKEENKEFNDRLRQVEINGSLATQNLSKEVKKNAADIAEMQEFIAGIIGKEDAAEKIAKDTATDISIKFGAITIVLMIVTVIIAYIEIVR